MNTSVGYHQAPRPPRVPLDEVLIKLHPEGYHQEFEADGINVGAGGISMRAPVLPQVGSTLRCQFDGPSNGDPIQMAGCVVWAHESGPYVGEFGIRFTELSEEDQSRIEALVQRWKGDSKQVPTIRLQLEGVDSPIVAEVQSETDHAVCVEQPLPFLTIGTAIRNESSGRRGHLDAVELKLEDQTPKLVLSIEYELPATAEQQPSVADEMDTLRDEEDSASIEAPPPVVEAPRRARSNRAIEQEPAPKGRVQQVRSHAMMIIARVAHAMAAAGTWARTHFGPRILSIGQRGLQVVLRFVSALRERLGEPPRRKQVPRSVAARAHLKNARKSRRKKILFAAIAALILAGIGVYGWTQASFDELTPEASADAATEPSAAPIEPAATDTQPAEGVTDEAEVEAAAAAPEPVPETVGGSEFGTGDVSRGDTYVLRMSNPVAKMEGTVEANGFSVRIPGALSLTRAGPIAAANPDVERSIILNRGDYSELTVRFVTGREPAYQVRANGASIEIKISR